MRLLSGLTRENLGQNPNRRSKKPKASDYARRRMWASVGTICVIAMMFLLLHLANDNAGTNDEGSASVEQTFLALRDDEIEDDPIGIYAISGFERLGSNANLGVWGYATSYGEESAKAEVSAVMEKGGWVPSDSNVSSNILYFRRDGMDGGDYSNAFVEFSRIGGKTLITLCFS